MRWRWLSVAAVLEALLLSSVIATAGSASAAPICIHRDLLSATCTVSVVEPGGSGGNAAPAAHEDLPADTGSGSQCWDDPAKFGESGTAHPVSCTNGAFQWSNEYGCYYIRMEPQPDADDPIWAGHDPAEGGAPSTPASEELESPMEVRVHDGERCHVDVVMPDEAPDPRSLSDLATKPEPAEAELATVVPFPTVEEVPAAPFQLDDDAAVVGLTGQGFLPGEHVAFAVVVVRAQTDADGTAALHLPTGLTARSPGPFVLFGQTSGTLVMADPFGGDQR